VELELPRFAGHGLSFRGILGSDHDGWVCEPEAARLASSHACSALRCFAVGAWGVGVFSDDLAVDVRGQWREALAADPQADLRRLTDSIVGDHRLAWSGDADDEEIVAWLALALAQHETGRLDDRVRDRALAIIETGADVDAWEEDGGQGAQRRRVLDRLVAKLRGPQPVAKRLRGRRGGPDPGVEVGDVVRVFNPARTRSSLWAVVDISEEVKGFRDTVVLGLYWDGGEVPSAEQLGDLPYLSKLDLSSFEGSDPPHYQSLNIPYVVAVLARNAREAFGPDVGEIVARGVRRMAWEPQPAYTFTGWERLVAMIDDGEFDMSLRATARRVADGHGVR
jgi:hypothetical protein